MKIKHWQGYGCVDAKKISMKDHVRYGETVRELHIRVTGEHEYGLARHDTYDVANWLIKRFDKSFDDYRKIRNMNIDDNDTVCDYYISYVL